MSFETVNPFITPERKRMETEPIVRFSRHKKVTDRKTGETKDVEKKFVAIAGVELEVYDGPDGSRFSDEEFADFSLDEASLDLLKRYAMAAKLSQPLLVEGETDIGKSKALEYLAHLTNHRLYRLSLSGQTDTTEFIGKYVPNSDDARTSFERILRNREKLSPASKAVLEEADEKSRNLTAEECRQVAENEGLDFGEKMQWIWQDGLIIKAMRHGNGQGTWLYLDELGAAEPQILVKINRIFEKFGRLELAENGNRFVEAGPNFRIFASTNPPEYAGRLPFAPDFIRRWVYQKLEKLPIEAIKTRLKYIFRREPTDVEGLLKKIGVVESTPLSFQENPKISEALEDFLPELFDQLRKVLGEGKIGKDQRQKFRYEFSDLARIGEYMAAFGGGSPKVALEQAVEFYLTSKLAVEKDRKEVKRILETVMRAKKTGEKLEAAQSQGTGETLEQKTAQEEAERLMAELNGGEVEELESHDLHDLVQELANNLQDNLNARYAGGKNPITIETPKLPENLTTAHLEAVKEALGQGKGFAERILPSLKSLNNLDKAYEDAMYPEIQSEEDTKKGLISSSPGWREHEPALEEFNFNTKTTWGEAYLASMRTELEALGNSLVLLDTATKPQYQDDTQQYGTKEGTDPDQDPLLPLFKEAFGKTANRFNHSWDDIEAKLLPLATAKIKAIFKAKDLPDTDFDVILVPSTLDNLEMTFHDPASSSTNTWEWTSTSLHDDEKKDTGRCLVFGLTEYGGAGCVGDDHRSSSDGRLGARLAVVFRVRH